MPSSTILLAVEGSQTSTKNSQGLLQVFSLPSSHPRYSYGRFAKGARHNGFSAIHNDRGGLCRPISNPREPTTWSDTPKQGIRGRIRLL